MKKEDKKYKIKLIIKELEKDRHLFDEFNGWLLLRDLNFHKVFYNPNFKEKEKIIKLFKAFKKDLLELNKVNKCCFNEDGTLKAIRNEPNGLNLKIKQPYSVFNRK